MLISGMIAWLKRFFEQTDPESCPSSEEGQQGSPTDTPPSPEAPQHTYSGDQPIRTQPEDRFMRWPFAKRIADTIAERRDPSSIVIGLYGPWGDGKTSTLNLMEKALEKHSHCVVVRFNPWYFQSEEQLLRGFFSTLADGIGKKLPTLGDQIGKFIKKYGSILSGATTTIFGIPIPIGDVVKVLGKSFSTIGLDQLKERIERLLIESGRRVVVMIDDIDRLDRIEVQAILKLVKLSASFNHTSYILSFDDEMVAAAVGERYGRGNYEAGRSFLEKIIQVPLHLPPADQIALRQMTFEGVDAAIKQADITLPQEQVDAFVRHFIDGLEPRLRTPRQAKLYVNALTFALPLLKGEAHPVDHMLIEGIRIFYPKLYTSIRDNPDYFLRDEAHVGQQRVEAWRQESAQLINRSLKGLSARDKERVRDRLLNVLFLRLRSGYSSSDWEQRWSREQRICSDQYFKRYFTYGVPPGDVSDHEVARSLVSLGAQDTAHEDKMLHGFADRKAFPQLIQKLRERETEIDPAIARRLALTIARNGALLPRERAMLLSDITFRQAAILVAHLLKRIPADEEREALAGEIFRQVQPLPFGFECLRFVRHDKEQPEAERLVPMEVETRVSAVLAERIAAHANDDPLHLSFGRDAPALYWLWNKQDGAAVTAHLRSRFEANPDEVDAFLDIYVGEAWGMESGLPHRSDFNRESYNAVAKLIDPEFIAANLRQRYGAELDTPAFHRDDSIPLARRIAHQFMVIHRGVQNESAQAGAQPQPSEAGG